MDMEKYTNSKIFYLFEWLYKLVVWNILTIFITLVVMAGPFLIFYFNQDFNYSGIFVLISIIFGVFAIIPTYSTTFTCIKIFNEDKGGKTIGLYFDRLLVNFKSLWKAELIVLPVITLFVVSMYIYYTLLNQDGFEFNKVTIWYSVGYNALLFCVFAFILCLLNMPMVISYFRTNTKTLLKFTLIVTFKKFHLTLIYLVCILMPILLCLFVNVLIPLWLLFGISLPQFIMYFASRKDYYKYVKDIETIKEDEIYRFKGEDLDESKTRD